MTFEKTPGWLDWHAGAQPAPLPTAARQRGCPLPCVRARSVQFPFAPERKYTPCDASKATALLRCVTQLGFARNVIVQATCHGADNRAMVDACLASERPQGSRRSHRASAASPTRSCRYCTTAGVRGAALQLRQAPGGLHAQGRAARDCPPASSRLGWHVVIYFEAVDLPELWDFFTAVHDDVGTTVVVDHMGRPDVRQAD